MSNQNLTEQLGYSVRFVRYYATRNGTQAQAEGLPSKAGSQDLESTRMTWRFNRRADVSMFYVIIQIR